MISYEIIDIEEKVIKTLTGTELRRRFNVAEDNPIFTEQLVAKFNLMMECQDKPERMRIKSPFVI